MIADLARQQVAVRPVPLGVRRAVNGLAISWTVLLGVGLFAQLLPQPFAVFGVLLIIVGTGAAAVGLFELVTAKGRSLSTQELSIWRGFARLVSWNPTEGVVFLKNKSIHFVDDNPHDGGGIRVIYPLFGEELVLRIPLEIQTLPFQDNEVLTKEYMPLKIQGTIYWRIVNLQSYYLHVSKEIHRVDDKDNHTTTRSLRNPQFEVAEQWLRAMAEEKTRTVVSRIGTGLLISDQLSADLPRSLPAADQLFSTEVQSSVGYRSATEGLANAIKSDFSAASMAYGLEIHEVRLTQVMLPPDIYSAAIEACRSRYLPLKAQAQAIERRLMLQAEADVIGRDATGMKEIAGSIPALAFQDFLAPLFLGLSRRPGVASQQSST